MVLLMISFFIGGWMYWFRESNIFGFIPWLIIALVLTLSGWLIATHAFNLEKKQRLLIGFGLGLVIYLWLLNLIGRWFEPRFAYILPAFIVLVIGLMFAWRSGEPLFDISDIKISPLFFLVLGLLIYTVLIERGLGIYDDYHHLPAISTIGAGNLPPKYMLNAFYDFSYHYGFELLGGSLMQLGNMFPWSALDISKSIVWVYSLILIALILKRYLEKSWKIVIGTALFIFMGGTRYLLMLFPAGILKSLDQSIVFIGISQDLNLPFSKALFAPWNIGGGPPIPFIYGFANGLNSPYILNHGGEWPLTLIILALLWLLSNKFTSIKAIPIMAILMAHLALTYESTYGLIMVSIGFIGIFIKLKKPEYSTRAFWYFVAAAAISIPFAILQGGTLLSIFKGIFQNAVGSQPVVIIHSAAESVFSFQWPPSIFSAHFGALSIFSLPQLMVGLFEIGPILLFAPFITRWAWKKFQKNDWMMGILITSTWVGFIISIFVSYNLSERDITRFCKHALSFWILFFIIMLLKKDKLWGKWTRRIVELFKHSKPFWLLFSIKTFLHKDRLWGRWTWWLAVFCTGLMLVSGVVNGWMQQSAILVPVLSEGIDGLDAQISNTVWGKLSQKDLIIDPGSNEWRATAVTGLLTVSSMNRGTTSLWKELSSNPSLEGFVKNNFRYLYVDQGWWRNLSDAQRLSLSNPCIRVVASASIDNDFKFRRLLDLSSCSDII
jgi:hypothetical protein